MERERRLERKVWDAVKQAQNQYKNDWVAVSGDAGLAFVLGVTRQTVASWRDQNVIPEGCYSQRVDRNTGEPKGHISYNLGRVLTALKNRLKEEYPGEFDVND